MAWSPWPNACWTPGIECTEPPFSLHRAPTALHWIAIRWNFSDATASEEGKPGPTERWAADNHPRSPCAEPDSRDVA